MGLVERRFTIILRVEDESPLHEAELADELAYWDGALQQAIEDVGADLIKSQQSAIGSLEVQAVEYIIMELRRG